MRIITFDLGTKTGWAVKDDYLQVSGTEILASAKEIAMQAKAHKDRCCDIRFQRIQNLVQGYLPAAIVAFEDVEFSTFTYQTQLWAGLRTALILACMGEENPPEIVAVPVGTLKKFATGRGNATKEMMAISLAQQDPTRYFMGTITLPRSKPFEQIVKSCRTASGSVCLDDNEVDAIHLLRYIMWRNKLS